MNLSALARTARQIARIGRIAAAVMLIQLMWLSAAHAAGQRGLTVRSLRCHRQAGGRCSAAPGHPTTSVPCPNAELVPTSANTAQIAAATLCLINQQRGRKGEPALRNDGDLDRSALQHSQDMVDADYFAHVSPTGQTPLERILASGYVPRGDAYELGENIALGTAWLATPAAIVGAWMASPDHRANILDADFLDSGIGVVAAVPSQYSDGEAGAVYTQDFGVVQAG